MAIAKFQMPDGRIAKFEVAEGTTPEQAQAMINDYVANQPRQGTQADLDYFKTRQNEQPQEQQIDTPTYLKNIALGVAARGNQAMNALNPFSDEEDAQRIAAEQAWVEQNKGAGIGNVLGDMMITAPVGGVAGIPARALATGLTEYATTPTDRSDAMVSGMAGSGVGDLLGNVAKFAIQPFKRVVDHTRQALIEKAGQLGIKLNAAQLTGNKTLQHLDNVLDSIPSSSANQQAAKMSQREDWQRVLFNQGNESASRPSQEVMGDMKARISGNYDDVFQNNPLIVDAQLKQDIVDIGKQQFERLPTNQKKLVFSYLSDLGKPPVGAQIEGSNYQNIRSMLDTQARGFENSDPFTSNLLKDIRKAADDAMQRNVSPDVAEKLAQANNDYAVMKSIEKSTDPVTETVNPNLLMNQLRRRDTNRVIYGQGNQDLTDIAKVGKAFIPDKVPDSGTAQKQMLINMLKGTAAVGAAEEYARTQDPAQSAIGGLGLMGASVLLPKAAQKALWNQNGYLSKGLIDLQRNPAATKLISELLRNAGTQTAVQNRGK